jgi:hypothetical protein
MTTPLLEADQLVAWARHDLEAVRGRVFLARDVDGFVGDDSVHFELEPPAKVRVIGGQITHWVDDWIDPYWDIELVVPHPQLVGVRSLWCAGICYRLNGERERSDLVGVERPTGA